MIDRLRQDVHYAVRQLTRAPLFTLLAGVSLALGIAVTVTAFSMLNSVLFKPLPVPEPEEIVHVYASERLRPNQWGRFSYADFRDYQQSGVFSSLTAHARWQVRVWAENRAPSHGDVAFVSPNFFQALGLTVLEGRPFRPNDDEPQIVISENYRRRAFSPGDKVIGAIVRVNNVPLTVVGVAQFRGFETGTRLVGWVPATQMQYVYNIRWIDDRNQRWWQFTGRLAPGITPEAAAARLASTTRELTVLYPQSWTDQSGVPLRVSLLTQRQSIIKPDGTEMIRVLATITALIAVVLMLACTNVAGLLLARALTRRHEIAVRLTLGASRVRLVSQLLTEAVLLALIGGALGFLAAQWAIRLAARSPIFDSFDLTADWRVLLITFGVSLLCSMIFGITPTAQALRVDLKAGLAGQAIVGERGGVRGRMMALQVMVSCLLILIAFSAGRGVRSQLYSEPGFSVEGLLVAELDLAGFRRDTTRRAEYITYAQDLLRSMTGVTRVTLTPTVPLSGTEGFSNFMDLPGSGTTRVGLHRVGADYFETLGIPLLAGRSIRPEDAALPGPFIAVVNRAFVDAHGSGVLGRTIKVTEGHDVTIVGVVEDVKHRALDASHQPYIYETVRDARWPMRYRLFLVSRVRPGVQQLVAAQLTRSLRDRFPDQTPPSVTTLRSRIEQTIAPQRYISNLALGIGLMELILAGVGLYGMLLYALLSRSREIGLRIALGARPRNASITVISDGLRFVAFGTVAGLALCVPTATFAARTFIGVRANDPMPFIAALVAVVLSSAAAAYIPARRAARVQPMTALRHE
jgi:predicted permease